MDIMDINLIVCEKEGEDRSLEFFKRECLDLFVNEQTMALEVDAAKLTKPKDKLQHLALKELEKEGVLVSHEGSTGTTSYFLRDEIWNHKKDFSLSVDALANMADLYNVVMPSLIKDVSLFRPIGALDVDVPTLEALIAVLHLSFASGAPDPFSGEEVNSEDGQENTFSFT